MEPATRDTVEFLIRRYRLHDRVPVDLTLLLNRFTVRPYDFTRVTLGFALVLPLPLVGVAFFAAGVGIALFEIWWHTALAERVPPHLLSRVSAYDWMGSLALLPLGYLIAGPLGEALGGREVLTAGAAVSIAVLASALLVRDTWTLRRLERVTA